MLDLALDPSSNPALEMLVNYRLTEYTKVSNYLHQMPGLAMAVDIGSQATVSQYLTVAEMLDSVQLAVTADVAGDIDSYLYKIARVTLFTEPTNRTTFIGGCSFDEIEYPGCLFPFFLCILRTMGLEPQNN